MLFFITLFTVMYYISGIELSCTKCKHFIPHHLGNQDLGLCEMFKNTCFYQGKESVLPNFAKHCRANENLCGKNGFLYEHINNNENHENHENQIIDSEFNNKLNELNNRCCGEVNEKDEIEQLEKEFFEVFQKIKSHNKKRIYKTTKDLYKLFKRDQR